MTNLTVHYLRQGVALCGDVRLHQDTAWPEGHFWTLVGSPDATCRGCWGTYLGIVEQFTCTRCRVRPEAFRALAPAEHPHLCAACLAALTETSLAMIHVYVPWRTCEARRHS